MFKIMPPTDDNSTFPQNSPTEPSPLPPANETPQSDELGENTSPPFSTDNQTPTQGYPPHEPQSNVNSVDYQTPVASSNTTEQTSSESHENFESKPVTQPLAQNPVQPAPIVTPANNTQTNQTHVANTVPPTTQMPVMPTPSDPGLTPPTTTPKKGFPVVKILILFSVLVILILSCSALFLLSRFLKENFVPGVSGYTEDLLLSDGEQFALRSETLYRGLLYHTLTEENSNLQMRSNIEPDSVKPFLADRMSEEINKIKKIDYDANISVRYDLHQSIKDSVENLMSGGTGDSNFVLGATDPGNFDEQTMTKVLESSEGHLSLYTKGSLDMVDEVNQKSSTNTEIKFESQEVNLNTQFEARYVDDKLFFNLDRFPRNEYLNFDEILQKWIRFGDEEESLSSLINSGVPFAAESEDIEFNQDDHAILIQLLNSDAVKNSISQSYPEKTGDFDTNCYVLNLTTQNIDNILREYARLSGEDYTEEMRDEIYEELDIEKFELHLCFSNSTNIPVKIQEVVAFNFPEVGRVEILFNFRMLSTNPQTAIEAPEQSVNYEDVDWDAITENLLPTTSPVLDVPQEPDNNFSTGFYKRDNICTILPNSAVCNSCRDGQFNCELCLYYLNEPSLGSEDQDFLEECMETSIQSGF